MTSVLLIAKRPALDRLSLSERERAAEALAPLRAAADAHAHAVALVRTALSGCQVREHAVDELHAGDGTKADVIVAVGGDGTVFTANALRAQAPLITVNSDPTRSVGHFTRTDASDFARVFAAWRAGTARIEALPRLRVQVNGGEARPFLNDCLFASSNPAAITRYRLDTDDTHEDQQSSGVWVATAAGSTGGIRSAGMTPEARSPALLFRVREPFQGRSPARVLEGRQIPPRGLSLTAAMPGIDLYLDGPHQRIAVPYGAHAIFTADPETLRLIVA